MVCGVFRGLWCGVVASVGRFSSSYESPVQLPQNGRDGLGKREAGDAMQGEARGMKDLIPEVYDELRQAAAHFFRRQPAGFTLQPTELVNEACIHLMRHSADEWNDAQHFRAIATKKVWQVVVDHIKARESQKRGGAGIQTKSDKDTDKKADPPEASGGGRWKRIPLDNVTINWQDHTVELLDLAAAIEELGAESTRLREVVTLHWFGGMKYADVAAILGVSASTVEKDFRYALAWLSRRLAGGERDANAIS